MPTWSHFYTLSLYIYIVPYPLSIIIGSFLAASSSLLKSYQSGNECQLFGSGEQSPLTPDPLCQQKQGNAVWTSLCHATCKYSHATRGPLSSLFEMKTQKKGRVLLINTENGLSKKSWTRSSPTNGVGSIWPTAQYPTFRRALIQDFDRLDCGTPGLIW